MPLIPSLIQNFKTDKQTLSPVQSIALDKPPYDEDWLQNLIHDNPGLVPAGDVEASFADIIPVVRELPLPSGFLDNLYVTPNGYPVLVEVKLYKNPEMRRKVVAQILEYAKDFAGLTYDTLNAAIQRGQEPTGKTLYEIATRDRPETLDEASFIDRLSRNLREGRFLLLILGDGVREDMADLANYLMRHSLRYAFGIIQIRLFNMPDGSILSLPDVMAKTQIIERHVTVVLTPNDNAKVTEGATTQQVTVGLPVKTSLSLEGFYDSLTKASPKGGHVIKNILRSVSEDGLTPEVGKNGDTLILRFQDKNVFYVSSKGEAQFWGPATGSLKNTAEGERLIREYLTRVAGLVGGVTTIYPKTGGMDVKVNEKFVTLDMLLGKEDDLKDAIISFVRGISRLENEAA